MLEPVHVGSGKVRELYSLGDDRLLLVASDRISVFDVVLPTPIPDKGRVLTGLSGFWFARTGHIVPNHLLEIQADGRSMVCRRLQMLPIECVVRGYLAGSGWKDYRESGAVSGHVLPAGMRESERLPEPIFTPATKATEGHDENIDEEQAAALCGANRYHAAKEASLALYRFATAHAEARGYGIFALLFPSEEEPLPRHFPGEWVRVGASRGIGLWRLSPGPNLTAPGPAAGAPSSPRPSPPP